MNGLYPCEGRAIGHAGHLGAIDITDVVCMLLTSLHLPSKLLLLSIILVAQLPIHLHLDVLYPIDTEPIRDVLNRNCKLVTA